ncbi:hypothetical protein FQN53_002839 [Emmonsiellopsis sp. PD_33]|nr:hypothetical protein FQN53_002839 [Emmonsiellopsis sp. PD_33]
MSAPNIPSSAAEPTPLKRRKVRKGTQSCWECKRRKTRCTFAAPTETVCDGCRSRRTKCVGQEFVHEVGGRIDKRRGGRERGRTRRVEERGDGDGVDFRGREITDLIEMTGSLDGISRALLSAWPDEHDLDLILTIPVHVWESLHGVVCMPYSRFSSYRTAQSSRQILRLPPPGSHPVLIARRLLMLGGFLQAVPPSSATRLSDTSSDYRTIMSRAVNAVSRLVTSNDELLDSLEGIECVMLESMYENNAGNLRRTWLINRRAMVMAQMMGLHTGACVSSSSIVLEAEARDRIDPNIMWFRIVCTDRYLSLMLGLPQGSLENVFGSPQALTCCTAIERMERIMTVAGGLILQRNSAQRTDLAVTRKVDTMLQQAAALMPPQWWLMATDTPGIPSNDAEAFDDTLRLVNQFAYRHLLVQLHLPYLMPPSSVHPGYDYSKMTAANTSRAIVAHFVSFRTSTVATAYCRGIDFVAFIASTTLCLAHIEARRQHMATSGGEGGVTVLQSLQHQRLSDRGLLERTLEIMDKMVRESPDAIAQKISSILRPLLAIEKSSASGVPYYTSATLEDNQQEPPSSSSTTFDTILNIQIPYFGTIKIEHLPPPPPPPIPSEPTQPAPTAWIQNSPIPQSSSGGIVALSGLTSSHGSPQGQGHRASSSNPFPAGYEISTTQPVNNDWQEVPSYTDQSYPSWSHDPGPVSDQTPSAEAATFATSDAQDARLLVPGLAADVDDWALQGVDMALFSNLVYDVG